MVGSETCLGWDLGKGCLTSLLILISLASGEVREAVGSPPPDSATSWRVGDAVPIAVAQGKATWEIPTAGPSSKSLVIVSALSPSPGPYSIRMTARAASEARPPRLADDGPRRAPIHHPLEVRPEPPSPAHRPAATRTFHLMVRDGDPASARNYLAVEGTLRAFGPRVQVYVDSRDVPIVKTEVLRDLLGTFEHHVYPTAAQRWGQARDVDGDGRFTILLSGWLGRLGGGRLAVDGFVRGADFDVTLAPPFGNRCDMMYLSASLAKGPHLRTVVAHEYTHAVTFSRKVLDANADPRLATEEEGWLDEAIAHMAEDVHKFSRSNLDYRISAYLSQPEAYRLVVPDYYAADLFRSHGNRGSTYLFLHWCVTRFGPELLGDLIRSDSRGIANLEASTGVPFASLYRQWSTALYLDAIPDATDNDGWVLTGPRPTFLRPGGPDDTWLAGGTSTHYAVVEGSSTGAVRIDVCGPPDARLQVTAVALPPDLPRLELSVHVLPEHQGETRIRALVRERDGQPVHLQTLAWEPLVPAANPHASGFRHADLDAKGVIDAFGNDRLEAHGQLASRPLSLAGARPEDGPLVFKLVGTDAQGRRIVAWADLPPDSGGAGAELAESRPPD